MKITIFNVNYFIPNHLVYCAWIHIYYAAYVVDKLGEMR